MLKVSNTPQGEWRDAIANHNRTLSVTLNPDGQTYTLAEGSGPTTAVRGGTLYFTMIPKTSNDPAGKEQYFSASRKYRLIMGCICDVDYDVKLYAKASVLYIEGHVTRVESPRSFPCSTLTIGRSGETLLLERLR